jgi:hypothetical protein
MDADPERVIVERRSHPRAKLTCPTCGSGLSHVTGGWPEPRGYIRQRKCVCGERYLSVERVDQANGKRYTP